MNDSNTYRDSVRLLDSQAVITQTVTYEGTQGTSSYTRKLTGYPHLVICGAGHVSLALSKAARSIGFEVTVIDNRPEFADPARFPKDVHVICNDFTQALQALPPDYAWYAVMTRGHTDDEACAKAILKRSYLYFGMIGSRTKTAHVRQVLTEHGFSQEQIDSIHAPIGLSIGARTPEEIAVSITAELIQERAKLGCLYLDKNVYKALGTIDHPFACATIIDKNGSAPRDPGSCLAVDLTTSIVYGTIGGGKSEAEAIKEAQAIQPGCAPFIREYDLSNGSAATLGMVCGGHITVLYEYTP